MKVYTKYNHISAGEVCEEKHSLVQPHMSLSPRVLLKKAKSGVLDPAAFARRYTYNGSDAQLPPEDYDLIKVQRELSKVNERREMLNKRKTELEKQSQKNVMKSEIVKEIQDESSQESVK